MPTPAICLIVASTRTRRFADIPLTWLREELGARSDLSLDVLDLREHPLPFFDGPVPPSRNQRAYASEAEATVGQALDAADGYIVLTNEYNHGYSAALKNLFDTFFIEFRHKPIGFIGYGNVGGSRAIEQLRLVAAELDMASVRTSAHIFGHQMRRLREDPTAHAEVFAEVKPRLDATMTDLLWWANALASARDADATPTD
ncbi:NAD(P)H-dependent oxidoreductase [Diaminobutyricibacter tongyongensis]|uniref:NAD(P)H-dependent oxidoreductase n=1 Tax=Leifsonia tongyongensis TaxID=1268043 RepID=A0A6L9XSJ1_9MICO|nr:NAD(P)H-dependent oxidoreductase [Diaminobutyricibacter tongyongensis]NEN04370.1 NAD(P)H-dependent oxidoreductase [Diaminobutyricibacter tongyongensis]